MKTRGYTYLKISETMYAYLELFCFDGRGIFRYDITENAIFAHVLQGLGAACLKQKAQVLLHMVEKNRILRMQVIPHLFKRI